MEMLMEMESQIAAWLVESVLLTGFAHHEIDKLNQSEQLIKCNGK